jgi:hypothetical protein
VIRQRLKRRDLLDDVTEVSVDNGNRRGLHYGDVLDGTVAENDCGYDHRNITVGVHLPVKSFNVQPVKASEFRDLLRELFLVRQWIGMHGPSQSEPKKACKEKTLNPFAHRAVEAMLASSGLADSENFGTSYVARIQLA